MPKALGGYDIVKIPDKEEWMCDGCGMLMHGKGHSSGTAREGKADICWVRQRPARLRVYCEECWEKATGQIPLDEVGPREVD